MPAPGCKSGSGEPSYLMLSALIVQPRFPGTRYRVGVRVALTGINLRVDKCDVKFPSQGMFRPRCHEPRPVRWLVDATKGGAAMAVQSGKRRRLRRVLGAGLVVAGGLVLVTAGANAAMWAMSSGHRSDVAGAPGVPVVIVPGAKVATDGTPMAYLRAGSTSPSNWWLRGRPARYCCRGTRAGLPETRSLR